MSHCHTVTLSHCHTAVCFTVTLSHCCVWVNVYVEHWALGGSHCDRHIHFFQVEKKRFFGEEKKADVNFNLDDPSLNKSLKQSWEPFNPSAPLPQRAMSIVFYPVFYWRTFLKEMTEKIAKNYNLNHEGCPVSKQTQPPTQMKYSDRENNEEWSFDCRLRLSPLLTSM